MENKEIGEYKIKITGERLTSYYSFKGWRKEYKSRRRDYNKSNEPVSVENKNKTLNRVRNNIKDTIDCNVGYYSKFITLTFKETCLDRAEALNHFSKFLHRYNYNYGHNMKYLMVMERQHERGKKEGNEGSWHFHIINFDNQKYELNEFKNVWKYGSVDFKKVDSTGNLGRYLMKYITKDMITDLKDKNKKSIFKSHNLKKPYIEYYNYSMSPYVKRNLDNLTPTYEKQYTVSYENKMAVQESNIIIMREYNIKDKRKKQ